ncbi:Uncharacterised protein [Mycobacteroides abscessus subsp. abscessus]|nr:Uncharacterised protein [Mycobacteroides abscessus subsp. abscessus]
MGTNTPVAQFVNRRSPRRISPVSGRNSPATSASTVDLPAPLAPTIANVSPAATVNLARTPRAR